MEESKGKTKVEKIKVSKNIDETKFKYPDDPNELRDEIINNLNACKNVIDIKTDIEEYYGEVMGRMAVGEI